MKHIRRVLCLALALALLAGVLPPRRSHAAVQADSMTAQGADSFGAMLARDLNEYQQTNAQGYRAGCAIADLRIEGSTARVEYFTPVAATLVVALYTEDGMELLHSTTVEVTPEENTVEVTLAGQLPEFFLAKAYLLDPVGLYPLCQELQSSLNTRWMKELLASKASDFDPELVWNFDSDDSTNFAVFHESVIRPEAAEGVNVVTTADEENHLYVIENADSTLRNLDEGDILAYEYAPGKLLIAKVGTVTVEDKTVTIQGVELEMSEVFSHLKLQADADASDVEVDTSAQTDFAYNGITDSTQQTRTHEGDNLDDPFEKSLSFTIGDYSEDEEEEDPSKPTEGGSEEDSTKPTEDGDSTKPTEDEGSTKPTEGGSDGDSDMDVEDDKIEAGVEISGALDLSFAIRYEYYISDGYDYMFFQADIVTAVAVNVEVSLSYTALTIPKMTVRLVPGVVSLGFEPKFVVELSASVTLKLTNFSTIGFQYETGMGVQNLSGTTAPELDFDVEGELFVGIDWQPTLEIGEGAVADINFPAVTGVRITAELTGTLFDDPDPNPTPRSKHTCKACIKAHVSGVVELGVELVFLGFIKVEFTLLELEPFPSDFYYSFTNNVLGMGECPYYVYRVTVRVLNKAEQPASGCPVSVLKDGEKILMGTTAENGVTHIYLAAGTHRLLTVVDGEELGMDLEVSEPCVTVMSKLAAQLQDPEFLREFMDAENITGYGKALGGGTCGAQGNNMTWLLFDSGALVISGTGKMADFDYNTVPWEDFFYKDITSIVLRGNITHIGGYAFYGARVDTLDIPYTVQSIGYAAFCQAWITRVNLPESITSIADRAFYGSRLEFIEIPDSITELGEYTFYNNWYLQEVKLPEGITYIGRSCFQACNSLATINLPDSITAMGSTVFRDCKSLTHVRIPAKMTHLPVSAFSNCTALVSVELPEGLVEIGTDAFRFDEKLTEITFPQGLQRIGSDSFACCYALTEVDIPASVENVGAYAFHYCSNLSRVIFRGNCPNELKLEPPFADPDDEPTYLIVYPFTGIHDEAVLYYPASGSGWTEENLVCFGGEELICQSYTGAPPAAVPAAPQAAPRELTLHAQTEAPVLPMAEAEPVTGLVWSEGAQLRTAFFEDLQPGRAYTLLALADAGEAPLSEQNLLYIARLTADEAGKLEVSFASTRAPATVLAYTAPWKDLADAKVTFPALTASKEPVIAAPTVIYGGKTLTLGADYILTGDALYTAAGTYRCTVVGIGNYTGRLECSYTVTEAGVQPPEDDPVDPKPDDPEQPRHNPFTDVKEGKFYYDPVLWAVEEGITSGMTPTTFEPDTTCTRGQVVTFLWRAAGSPKPASAKNPFKDVAKGAFYYDAVLWAVEKGITQGMSETAFEPNSTCTRGQVVTFLHRYAETPAASAANPFKDVAKGAFYYNAVLWAVQEGVTSGMTPTAFEPNTTCTRGQIVTFLYRALN